MGATSDPGSAAKGGCPQRMVTKGDAQLHFHHVHFNTTNVDDEVQFFVKFFSEKAIDFCVDSTSNKATRAVQTARGYFLFNAVSQPPDPALNSCLEHIGYLNPPPVNMELQRLMALNVKLWPVGDNLQCMDVTKGMACIGGGYFYVQMPNGGRIEVAGGPTPPDKGFGHLHLRGPLPDFYMKVLGPALMGMVDSTLSRPKAQYVDDVNLTNLYLDNSAPDSPVESKDKPIGHFAYSTTDLMGTLDRIKAAGIQLAEDVSFKPEYGFKSFFVKSPQGVWVEIVEDAPFKQAGSASP